ncbi:uncharacterized protein G6M90_00g052650 [Metarhizium brunneum]|uniref:Uncharacterized protein n=1 Tax=Metarhizium brunneum TaxID=500148 RepID=A0A7D5UY56_9HYPO
MRISSPIVCSLLAASAIAAPVLKGNEVKALRKPSFAADYGEIIQRDVDVAIDGKPVHIEGGYIRNSDLKRLGWDIRDRDEKRQVDVDGVATRSGWGYIKARDEKRQVDVDGVATRSGWSYIKARDEKR